MTSGFPSQRPVTRSFDVPTLRALGVTWLLPKLANRMNDTTYLNISVSGLFTAADERHMRMRRSKQRSGDPFSNHKHAKTKTTSMPVVTG